MGKLKLSLFFPKEALAGTSPAKLSWYNTNNRIVLCYLDRLYFIVHVIAKEGLAGQLFRQHRYGYGKVSAMLCAYWVTTGNSLLLIVLYIACYSLLNYSFVIAKPSKVSFSLKVSVENFTLSPDISDIFHSNFSFDELFGQSTAWGLERTPRKKLEWEN